MLLVDIILIVVIILAILNGLRSGFIVAFGSFLGLVAGFIASGYLVSWLQNQTDITLGLFTSILLFFVFALIISRLLGWVADMLDEAYNLLSVIPGLKSINKALGGLFGFFEALVAIGAFILLLRVLFPETMLATSLSNSFILGFIEEPLLWIVDLLFKEVIEASQIS